MKTEPAGAVLLVDDETTILRALTPALRHAGFTVDTAQSGEAALSQLASSHYDLLLLDLGLPEMDGQEIIRRVREWSDVVIVVLSARDLESDIILALDNGADDYVVKPFAIGELMARVRAALRGYERRINSQAIHCFGDVSINLAARQVMLGEDEVRLTPREYEFVRTLAAHAGRVVTHKQLIAAVWGAAANADAQFVRVLVGQVRQKLEEDPTRPRLIRTEPGLGYRLVVEGDQQGR